MAVKEANWQTILLLLSLILVSQTAISGQAQSFTA